MGQLIIGNTLPTTGWRNWKKRLSGLAGGYEPDLFTIPTITPQSFWKPVPGYNPGTMSGLGGHFQTVQTYHPQRYGVGDIVSTLENNAGLVLAGAALLAVFAFGKRRRR